MMKLVNFRFEDEFIELLKNESEKASLTQTDYIKNCVHHFLECRVQQKHDLPTLRLIITKYQGQCSKCNQKLSIGSLAYYGRDSKGVILVCLDCMVQGMGDKALAHKYLKMRELEKTIKALRREAESLAQKIEDAQVYNKFEELFKVSMEAHKLVMEFLRDPFLEDKDKTKLEDYERLSSETMRITREIDDFLQRKVGQKVKPK